MNDSNPKLKISEQNYEGILKKYPQVFENAPDGILITDSKGIILDCNITEQELTGYDYKEIVGKHITAFHSEKYKELFKKKLQEVKIVGFVEAELEIVHKSGKLIPIWRKGTPVTDEDGNVLNIVAFSRDISKLKEAEQKLTNLNINLERKVEERTTDLKKSEEKYREAYNRAEFYKDLFAHDMNNNLQAILSSVELVFLLLKSENYSFHVEDLLDKIKKFVGNGARIISDIKKLSKIEKEDHILIQPIEVLAILKNVIENTQNQFLDNEVNVEIETSYEKVIVQANELMHDVFENILTNAIKHNKNLVVEVMIRISKIEKDGINFFKFSFIDNGMGISDKSKEKIFQRGYMEDKSLRGMGLGLSLVKKIIDNFNGHIWVEDKVQGDHSKGSNFIIYIPEAGE